jgi:hypothetical protein
MICPGWVNLPAGNSKAPTISKIMDEHTALLRRHHELFADENEPFTENWANDYFWKYKQRMDIEYHGETDSNNPACGDEAEYIYSEDNGEKFYWICTSTGGPKGPFTDIDEAISALGYDPKTFEFYP